MVTFVAANGDELQSNEIGSVTWTSPMSFVEGFEFEGGTVGPMNFGVVVEEPFFGFSEVNQDPVHVYVYDFFVHVRIILLCFRYCLRIKIVCSFCHREST